MTGLPPFPSFEAAAKAVLEHLNSRIGMQLWMLTRVVDDDWIVLIAEDRGYGTQSGEVLRWADSFCSRMVEGLGPQIAPDSDAVAAYRDAPIRQQMEIRAYAASPIRTDDGQVFGTICAIDPETKPVSIADELPLINLLSNLLAKLLDAELRAHEAAREADRLAVEVMTDSMTGVFNRRGWETLLEAEDARCERFASKASVLMVDLDKLKQTNDTLGQAAGDELIRTTARVLLENVRSHDVVARLGGDEFGVLSVECNEREARVLHQRVTKALTDAGVDASVGRATRRSAEALSDTTKRADTRMMNRKQSDGTVHG